MSERIGLEAVLDDADFQKGIAGYMSAMDKAKDHTSNIAGSLTGSLKSIGGGLLDLGATAAKLTFGAAVAGATALAGGLAFSVKAASEAQTIDAQLDAVLKSTAQAAESAGASLQGVAAHTKASSGAIAEMTQDLTDATLKYNTQGAAIQEQKQKLIDLTARYGDNGLAVLKAKAALAESENAHSKLGATIDSLKGKIADGSQIIAATAAPLAAMSTGALMGKQAFIDLADSLSKVTPYEDDAILSAENMLLTFTSIGKDVFPQATETVLNMSQALGQDLKSSSMQLGKALNDPVAGVTALQRVGVKLTDSQKALIESLVASGDVAGAQKVILKELETEFGNSARMAGTTFAGQVTILKNNLGNVAETIGGALLPGLTSLATGISTTLNNPQTQAAISGLAAGLGKLFSGDVKGAIESVSGGLSSAFGPETGLKIYQFLNGVKDVASTAFTFISTTVVPVLVGAFQSVVAWVTANWPMIQKVIQTVIQVIGDVIRVMWTQVIPTLIQAFQSAVGWVTANWPMISGIIQKVMQIVGQVISFVVTNVIPVLVAAFQGIFAWVQTNWPAIRATIETAINTISTIITTVMAAVRAFWEENGAAIVAKALEIWKQIQDFISAAIEFVQHVITSTLSTIKRIWDDNHEAIMATVSRIWEVIKGIVQTAVKMVQDIIKLATDLLKGNWKQAWEDVKQLLKDAWDGMLLNIKNMWELIKTEITLALGVIKTLFGTKWEEIKTGINTTLEGIKTIINTALDNVKTAITNKVEEIKTAAAKIGENIINGIVAGVDAAKHFIQSAIQNLLNSLPQWAKDILGIASPSKVFFDIGANISIGMAKGIMDAAGMVAGAAAQISDIAMGGAIGSAAQRVTAPASAVYNTYNYGNTYQLSANYRNTQSEGSLRDTVRLLQVGA